MRRGYNPIWAAEDAERVKREQDNIDSTLMRTLTHVCENYVKEVKTSRKVFKGKKENEHHPVAKATLETLEQINASADIKDKSQYIRMVALALKTYLERETKSKTLLPAVNQAFDKARFNGHVLKGEKNDLGNLAIIQEIVSGLKAARDGQEKPGGGIISKSLDAYFERAQETPKATSRR